MERDLILTRIRLTHRACGPVWGALGAASGDSPIGDMMQSLVIEGEVFEEALMNPVLLALSTYLTGYSSVLLTMACFIKGPNKTELPLHCDAMGPSPLSSISTECNLTYALTDYTREKGCLLWYQEATSFVVSPEAKSGWWPKIRPLLRSSVLPGRLSAGMETPGTEPIIGALAVCELVWSSTLCESTSERQSISPSTFLKTSC